MRTRWAHCQMSARMNEKIHKPAVSFIVAIAICLDTTSLKTSYPPTYIPSTSAHTRMGATVNTWLGTRPSGGYLFVEQMDAHIFIRGEWHVLMTAFFIHHLCAFLCVFWVPKCTQMSAFLWWHFPIHLLWGTLPSLCYASPFAKLARNTTQAVTLLSFVSLHCSKPYEKPNMSIQSSSHFKHGPRWP